MELQNPTPGSTLSVLEASASRINTLNANKSFFFNRNNQRCNGRITCNCSICGGSFTPPAARLVGIEPNPGPQPRLLKGAVRDLTQVAVAQAGAALGQALARSQQAGRKQKKSKSARQRRSHSTPMLRNPARVAGIAAPVSMGTVMSQSNANATRVKFDFSSVLINKAPDATYTTQPVLFAGASSGATRPWVLMFCPQQDIYSSAKYTCITPSNYAAMANIYRKYRYKSIRCTYVPICGTSTPGNVTLSFMDDLLDSGGSQTWSLAASTGTSITTPVWQSASIDLTRLLDNEWRYVNNDENGIASSRQSCSLYAFGNFIGTNVVPAGTLNTFGYLHFSGELELAEVGPYGNQVSLSSSSSNSSSTSTSSSSSSSSSGDYNRHEFAIEVAKKLNAIEELLEKIDLSDTINIVSDGQKKAL